MSSLPPDGVPHQPAPRPGALYEGPREGLKAVRDDYLYWSGRLTDTSFQLSLGVIGANWAVFGSVQKLLDNFWARLSLLLVILSLAVSVVGCRWMSELHRQQVDYAGEDPVRWGKECDAAFGKVDPWPFTKRIESLGRRMRWLKMWLTLLAGAAFLVALFYR